MTSAWFLGAGQPANQDESAVRSTIEPIRTDGESTEDTAPPEFNEFESDESTQLVGLSPRMVTGDFTGSSKSSPVNTDLITQNHNSVIDNQVATSGTAAQRESRGERGHGSMPFTTTLTPEIRDGAKFGNDHFAAMSAPIQEGAGEYMSAAVNDSWASMVSQAFANDASRSAYNSTMYNQFLEGSAI